ncbi:hypothetical protein ACHAXN_002145 [Cyclotella atomus]
MSRTWIYTTSTEGEDHLNERVERAVLRCLDGSFSYFREDQTSPHTNLSYHLTTLPPQTEADIENDMDYLSKKDSRSGIEPYPNHGVHVPNASLIRFDANGEYALNLPLVQGTVVGYSPPLNESISNTSQDGEFETERQKENDALYRILWDGSSDGVGYLEDVTLKELLALKRPDRQLQALAVHKSVRATAIRERLTLQWKMESLLTKLVVLAGLELRKEIGQKVRLELLLERKRLRDAADGMEKGRGGTKSRGEINADGNEFEYYLKHPNQYMSSFQPPPPLPSDDEGEDDDDRETTKPRSKTKLTKEELIRYSEKVDERCSFAPSKLAERVKLACSIAFNYASRNGLLDEYFAESQRRKERERVSREEIGAGSGGIAPRWAAAAEGEVRRSSRAKNAVNYAEDGTQNVESILNDHEGISTGSANVGLSSDFPRKDVSGGPTAIYLLELLGFSDGEKGTNPGAKSEDEEGDDPFFEPDPCHVIDQLGRKQRYMSTANIQDSICRNIDGHHIDTPESLLDEEQIDESGGTSFISDIICLTDDKVQDLPHFEPASFARCRFATRTFIPASEDDDDAAKEDPEAQKQAKVEARAAARKRKEERKKKRLAAEQKRNARLETLYRSQKSFELWRFKSIHGNGCAIWPSWSDRSKSILKDLFVMSRASSANDLVSKDTQPETEGANISQSLAGSSASIDQQTLNDEVLAQSLAAEISDVGEPLAKRRRTTRRGAGGDEPVFYGSHQSMSKEQLLSTLVRILRQAKAGSSSIIKLKQLVFATDFEASRGEVVEWRKLRSVLGHLVFRMGRLGRLLVDVEGDSTCWDLLKEGALVKFEFPATPASENGSDAAPILISVSPNEDIVEKLSALEQYVQNLHMTELFLRNALMKAIDKGGQTGESLLQVSTVAIATAADEVEGEAGAEDWKFFNSEENQQEISWNRSDHILLNKVIFRPSTSPLVPSDTSSVSGKKCQWYKVVSFTPSVKGEQVSIEDVKQSQDPNAFEPNPVVERRMRFRAVPIAPTDVDSKVDMDDADDMEHIILTEAQVRAGMEAGVLHRQLAQKNSSAKLSSPNISHPFKNKTGSKVMLTPVDGEEAYSDVIYGVIAGHDHIIENNVVNSKVLILLDDSCSIWATVNNDGTLLTDIVSDSQSSLCSSYKIDMHEYAEGSEAYTACESILTYMKHHQRSGPFSVPVDPVALQLPDYFDVIKRPMDISTLARNLEEGKYSRIPPKSDDYEDQENPIADHPVYKMAYGPFYEDAMLIFDNAILYNSIESWVGKEADLMKKNVIRKVDQVVNKATASFYRQESKAPQVKKSMYAEEDSDVDMYEYESDYDDEEEGRSKSKKGKAKKALKPRVQDDIPSRAIEKPYILPDTVVGFNVSGAFPHVKVCI